MIQSNPIETNLYQFDPMRFNLIPSDPFRTNQMQFDQIFSFLLRFTRLIFCHLFFSNRAKNINVDTGVIVFDDIKDCDVNVTYDLIDGEFPPPNISGKAFLMFTTI